MVRQENGEDGGGAPFFRSIFLSCGFEVPLHEPRVEVTGPEGGVIEHELAKRNCRLYPLNGELRESSLH